MAETIGLIVAGSILFVLAIILFIWYRTTIDEYYSQLVYRYDIREFIEKKTHKPGPESILVVSIIVGAIGLAVLVIGILLSI